MILSGTGAPATLFFEDLHVGRSFDLGTVVADRDEMIEFARRYDPQWYHVDPERAAASPYGDVIASGFYTAGLFMRAYVNHVLSQAAASASPGMEELRWFAAVHAGDRLAGRLEVIGAEPSTSRPGYGTAKIQAVLTRVADGKDVFRTTFRGWFACRPAEER